MFSLIYFALTKEWTNVFSRLQPRYICLLTLSNHFCAEQKMVEETKISTMVFIASIFSQSFGAPKDGMLLTRSRQTICPYYRQTNSCFCSRRINTIRVRSSDAKHCGCGSNCTAHTVQPRKEESVPACRFRGYKTLSRKTVHMSSYPFRQLTTKRYGMAYVRAFFPLFLMPAPSLCPWLQGYFKRKVIFLYSLYQTHLCLTPLKRMAG